MTKKDLPSPELLRKLLRYEPDTGKLFWKERPVDMFKTIKSANSWNTRYSGKEALAADNGHGYLKGSIFRKTTKAHRVAWAMYHGEWPNGDIDHINGIKDDNRIENLRDVNALENLKNRALFSNNTSGYNGVYWCKSMRKWQAYININGERKRLGYFDSIENAIIARRKSEIGQGYTDRHGLRD